MRRSQPNLGLKEGPEAEVGRIDEDLRLGVAGEKLRPLVFPPFLCHSSILGLRMFLPVFYAELVLFLLGMTAHTAMLPDTLVVCPSEFRTTLVEWEKHRRQQGHVIQVIEPPNSAAALRATIQLVAQGGRLKYLVLVGDTPRHAEHLKGGSPINQRNGSIFAAGANTVPTNYVPAKINARWGSEPAIATDIPYGDLGDCGVPVLAIGRIPADSAAELQAYLRKVIRYEQQERKETSASRLYVVAGVGGFGTLIDSAIEAAGRCVFQQTVPTHIELRHEPLGRQDDSTRKVAPEDFRLRVRDQFRQGGLAWVYLGHGSRGSLSRVAPSTGAQPLLSVADVTELRCGEPHPLAVLVACSTGEFDAIEDCLAEKLALAEYGPIAVIAATRVTMPYGNTVLGYELLRACFQTSPKSLGDLVCLAQRRTLEDAGEDSIRASLDVIAAGISPPPVDLLAERIEHVLMYHLLGDPLLRLRVPQPPLPQPHEQHISAPN